MDARKKELRVKLTQYAELGQKLRDLENDKDQMRLAIVDLAINLGYTNLLDIDMARLEKML
jgi:hypothetical protein